MAEHGWQGAVERLRADVDAVLALDVGALEVADAGELRRSLRRATDQLQAVAARLLARVEEDGRWSAGGTRTFGEWVARRELTSVGAARREAELGRALDGDLPATAQAVALGAVTLEHAQVLARLAPTSDARRAALSSDLPDRNEEFLLERAAAMPVDAYRREVQRWATRVDQAAAEQEHERACVKEHLTWSRRDDGVVFQGFLTAEHGVVLATALRAVAGVPAGDDVRSREERQAAALVDSARLVLDRGLSGEGQQVRPHVMVHVSWQEMQRLAAEHPATREGGPGADPAELPAPAELSSGVPVPRTLLDRFMCDSEVSRVVFGPNSTVLDVGRAQRTYTGQVRRAVVARDRSCRYPGCGAPVTLGEVHHVVPWSHGGATSVRNGVLLCWFHHDLVHRRRIAIRRVGVGWEMWSSDGRPIGGATAGPPGTGPSGSVPSPGRAPGGHGAESPSERPPPPTADADAGASARASARASGSASARALEDGLLAGG